MPICLVRQTVIPYPAICAHHAAGGHCVTNEGYQVGSRCVGHMPHSYTPEAFGLFHLHSDQYDACFGAASTFSARFDASDQSFVNFHLTRQPSSFGPHHGHSVALQHRPRYSIAGSHCARAFERFSRYTVLCRCYVPGGFEPSCQWRSRFVQDRACANRRLGTARRAHQSVTRLTPWYRRYIACRADKSVWPAQFLQISCACIVLSERGNELPVHTRVIVSWCQCRRPGRFVI